MRPLADNHGIEGNLNLLFNLITRSRFPCRRCILSGVHSFCFSRNSVPSNHTLISRMIAQACQYYLPSTAAQEKTHFQTCKTVLAVMLVQVSEPHYRLDYF